MPEWCDYCGELLHDGLCIACDCPHDHVDVINIVPTRTFCEGQDVEFKVAYTLRCLDCLGYCNREDEFNSWGWKWPPDSVSTVRRARGLSVDS